jgi:ABC-type Zn uptake system ZnuABC Zn-binding protein ZnuA
MLRVITLVSVLALLSVVGCQTTKKQETTVAKDSVVTTIDTAKAVADTAAKPVADTTKNAKK